MNLCMTYTWHPVRALYIKSWIIPNPYQINLKSKQLSQIVLRLGVTILDIDIEDYVAGLFWPVTFDPEMLWSLYGRETVYFMVSMTRDKWKILPCCLGGQNWGEERNSPSCQDQVRMCINSSLATWRLFIPQHN